MLGALITTVFTLLATILFALSAAALFWLDNSPVGAGLMALVSLAFMYITYCECPIKIVRRL